MIDFDVPDILDFHMYLRLHRWEEQPPGPAGSLWVRREHRVGVPNGNNEDLLRNAIDRVASAERRKPKDVAAAARHIRFDVAHLRTFGKDDIADAIPLETASQIISSARSMLRATATTARTEKGEIGRRYSKLGDGVVKKALMGHTEKGSFVIPILVPLPDITLEALGLTRGIERSHDKAASDDLWRISDEDNALFSFIRVAAPEPFERRVVRTFAQSMQAVQELVVDSAREPSTTQIHELVYRGVSKEFCLALSNILAQPPISKFESRIEWTSVVRPPETMRSITIDADAGELVRVVARKLHQQKVDSKQVFSGTIVQLRHEHHDDPFGEIAVSTVRRGHQAEIVVRLPFDAYYEAWDWHSQGRAILVEGLIERIPGQRLRVNNPDRCEPLDALMIPGIA